MLSSPNPTYRGVCPCVRICLCMCTCMCVCISLDADIGGFKARSMGHVGCLNVCYLGLEPIDHFQERECERVSLGVSRVRILHFDLEGQQGAKVFSYPGTYSKCKNTSVLSCEDPSVIFKPVSDSFRSQATHRIFTNCINVKWNAKMMLHAADPSEPLSTARFHFLSSFAFWSVIYQLNGYWDYAGKWHFKDGLTTAHVPDCPKSKNNGCTTILQNKNLQKTLAEIQIFWISALKSDCP